MKSNTEMVLLVIMAIMGLVTLVTTIRVGDLKQDYYELQTQAIQLGYAYHEPTNGIWQWKTNVVLERK
jgi:hypothetical protein